MCIIFSYTKVILCMLISIYVFVGHEDLLTCALFSVQDLFTSKTMGECLIYFHCNAELNIIHFHRNDNWLMIFFNRDDKGKSLSILDHTINIFFYIVCCTLMENDTSVPKASFSGAWKVVCKSGFYLCACMVNAWYDWVTKVYTCVKYVNC